MTPNDKNAKGNKRTRKHLSNTINLKMPKAMEILRILTVELILAVRAWMQNSKQLQLAALDLHTSYTLPPSNDPTIARESPSGPSFAGT